ncbi:nuclear transport factor 2 family protein [Streptomyces sp. NPDC002285]
MASNKEKIANLWRAFNDRDWQAMVADLTDEFGFYDNGILVGGIGKQAFTEYEQAFVNKNPDQRIFEIDYIEAGNIVISICSSLGTNDGEGFLPGLEPTGKQCGVRFCAVWRFDDEGRIIGVEGFYDQLASLVELGHTSLTPVKGSLHLELPPHVAVHYA